MQFLLRAFLLSIVVSGLPITSNAQDVVEKLEKYLESVDLNGSVIVTHGGETLLSSGYGKANFEHSVRNSSETVFRIGSITKQFTSMAILILQDRGVLSVEGTVGDHFTDAPELWQTLTIHQLLSHTSGIMHSWALPGFSESMAVPTNLDETLSRFYDQPLLFEPGSDYAYSGVGYFLLAKIIEQVSGQLYGDFLQENIFDPVGMEHTGMDRPEVVISNRATGYQRSEEGVTTNAADINMPILTGGGNMFSTVGDLALWDQALLNQELVSAKAYDVMYRPVRNNYAYGWGIRDFDGTKLIRHGGSVPGFGALIFRLPEKEICVVLLTNQVRGPLEIVASDLARIVLSE